MNTKSLKNYYDDCLLFLFKKLNILVKPIAKPPLPVTLVAVPKGSNNKYTTVMTPIISDENPRYFSSKGAIINRAPPGTAATANFESAHKNAKNTKDSNVGIGALNVLIVANVNMVTPIALPMVWVLITAGTMALYNVDLFLKIFSIEINKTLIEAALEIVLNPVKAAGNTFLKYIKHSFILNFETIK